MSPALHTFLWERIKEEEAAAHYLIRGYEEEIRLEWAGLADEHGPMTPDRKLHAEMWTFYAGQSKTRNFAKGQKIADLASPQRILSECAAKRKILEEHKPDRLANFYWGDRKCKSCQGTWHTWLPNRPAGEVGPEQGCQTLRALATIYAGHPDYRQEWKA